MWRRDVEPEEKPNIGSNGSNNLRHRPQEEEKKRMTGKPGNFDSNRLDYNDFASKLAGIKNAISTNEMMHEEIYSEPVV